MNDNSIPAKDVSAKGNRNLSWSSSRRTENRQDPNAHYEKTSQAELTFPHFNDGNQERYTCSYLFN